MPNLIISEFASLPSTRLIASQTVAIGGTSAQSVVLNERATHIRLFAEASCQVAIGADPDADTDPIIPLAAGQDFILQVHERSEFKVAVVERTVA
jgi:hypothetical protein